MWTALALARRGLGQVHPNPAVGCVLVRDDMCNTVVGRGWTQPGGRPHAEAEALKRAGNLANGSTAYISLEPCSHYGETEPCSKALVRAGVKRVFIAVKDPDKRVSGTGINHLKSAGIEVHSGLLEKEARKLNLGFFSRINFCKPTITWKVASSADGKIATKTGDSQWITSVLSRNRSHLLRAEHDAILTSIKTAINDNPRLNCRLPGMTTRSPQPIVLDSKLRLPPQNNLMRGKNKPWIYTNSNISEVSKLKFEKLGAKVFPIKLDNSGRLSLAAIVSHLAEIGITRVLLECGGELAASFMNEDLIDKIFWFQAPILIGGDGLSVINDLGITKIDNAIAFSQKSTYIFGSDTLKIFERKC